MNNLTAIGKFISQLSPNEPSIGLIIDSLINELNLGNSCIKLSNLAMQIGMDVPTLIDKLKNSNLVHISDDGELDARPLTLIINSKDEPILYLSRYAFYEKSCAKSTIELSKINYPKNPNIDAKLNQLKSLSKSFPNAEQLNAIATSLYNKLSLITGGPGTGKTTTVVLILWILITTNPQLKIKLAAPTGKAVNRLRESINNNLTYLNNLIGEDITWFNQFLQNPDSCLTLHRLLGVINNNIYFKHNQNKPLDLDVLIIDEASMIGLPTFYKLLDAIDPNKTTHLIFLGDPNQLSSVEEGYIFTSLVNSQICKTSKLLHSNRNITEIADLALAILDQNITQIKQILSLNHHIKLSKCSLDILNNDLFSQDHPSFYQYYLAISQLDQQFDFNLFKIFNQFKLLSPFNQGLFGVDSLNQIIEKFIKQQLRTNQSKYNGRPIMILQNDYVNGLYNGDIGIGMCNDEGRYMVYFENKTCCAYELLPKHTSAYAFTIHKTQGSEFDHLAIVIGNEMDNFNLISQELIYTAITRAKQSVHLYGELEHLLNAIQTKSVKVSGFEYMLDL